ncbi:hypothetical protein RISK_005253 [Rhodopirellula islandica]|uniref:Uncharacterized protein n=1 Tax=Rhodopirellula islandica TaxID=595434 RepID=A0A0J1B622_RHOIS|nr:hypothetical protein RISK_005253 [Rhodopirellula islandica]
MLKSRGEGRHQATFPSIGRFPIPAEPAQLGPFAQLERGQAEPEVHFRTSLED